MDEEKQKAFDAITAARIKLIFLKPFWGNIATRLILRDASEEIPTAATDGRNLIYNAEFINKLKCKDEVIFVVGHELLHVIYDHAGLRGRRGDRDPQLWNIAADYVVNQDLVKYGIGKKPEEVPILYDTKYIGWTTEQVYDDLYENADKIDIVYLAEKLLDEHLDNENMTEEEKEALKDEIRESILSAAQVGDPSSLPDGIKRLIKDLTESEMSWKDVLRNEIESQVKRDYTYMRPSRKGWGCDAVLPSMNKDPAIEAFVAMDMSGSVGEPEAKKFLSELVGIMEQFQSFKIDVCTWDTEVYGYQRFTEDNYMDIFDYELQGRGGTDPTCVFKYILDNDIDAKQVVMLTDGEIWNWGNGEFDTLWVIKNDCNKDIVAPHGETVYFNE